jgi:hypothetical protein
MESSRSDAKIPGIPAALQQHGTLKDTQGMLRHASIKTTGDVYVQTIEQSVLAAVNSRSPAVLGDWKKPEKSLGLKGEKSERSELNSAKFGEVDRRGCCKCLKICRLMEDSNLQPFG